VIFLSFLDAFKNPLLWRGQCEASTVAYPELTLFMIQHPFGNIEVPIERFFSPGPPAEGPLYVLTPRVLAVHPRHRTRVL